MRVPKPYLRKQTSTFYVQLHGRQINLGKDEQAAWKQYHELMAIEPLKITYDYTVAELVDRFLAWVNPNQAERTYEFYQTRLQAFIDYIGKSIKISELQPFHVTQWLSTVNGGDTHKSNYVRSVKRAFKWAADEKYIQTSPLATYKSKHRPQSRDVYITPQQWQQFISGVKPGALHDVLIFMRQTGCRPFECRQIEAHHIDGHCIVFEKRKSKGKLVRRVIPLPNVAYEIVQRLAAKYPEGPLFRGKHGQPWSTASLGSVFRNRAKKLKLTIYPQAMRHTFCTDMLMQGIDPIKLAEIMGQRSLKMIMEVYSHLSLKRDELRQELEKCVTSNDAKLDHPISA
jgi:integrase